MILMILNYFKTALRHLRKNKVFSLINILGLSIGLACCGLIAAYLRDETSYDTYPVQAGQIYRVDLGLLGNTQANYPMVDVAVGPGMEAAYPSILAFTRLGRLGTSFVQTGTRQFKEKGLAFADSSFFSIFTVPFLEGDAHTALVQPNSLVITKSFAAKYFGEGPALGKTLDLLAYGACRITGVIEKIPDNAHFHFDAFLSLTTLPTPHPTWSNAGYYTYLLLAPQADPKKLQARFPELVAKYVVPEVQHDMGVTLAEAQKAVNTFVFSLIPITDIHLHSNTKYELEANGDNHYIFIFGALAIFILLLACANFTNLSTAGSAARAREVGVRKVMGSVKSQLVVQFLTESILLTACAMVLAMSLVSVLLPWFNQVSGKNISFQSFMGYFPATAAFGLILLVGSIAGLYPAFFLSSFNTIKVLKGGGALQGGRNSLLRSGLVVFQFFVSIALIAATGVVYRQLRFMQDKQPGYDREQVLYIQDAGLLGTNQEVYRQLLLRDKRVLDASISWCVPGSGEMNGTEIYPKSDSAANSRNIHANIYQIDYDYLPTLGLQLINGRNFSREFPTDSTGVLINEAAAADLGWAHTDPIGKTIIRSGRLEYKVVGVVRDFHYLSVKEKIAPLMMLLGNNGGGILVKINNSDAGKFLADARKNWSAFHPAGPFAWYFLDERFAGLYAAEERTGRLFTAFTIIAIVIAGLGLFGLATYAAEQRRREIGIRKVLGATIPQVLTLISKEFLFLITLAFLLSIPVTWWAMQQWLRDFAYRAALNAWNFVGPGAAALFIALLAVSFQATKAALTNPVKSLRSE